VFLQQADDYREKVLPARLTARVAVEAGVDYYWWPFVGAHGKVIGMDTFGASAPAKDLFEEYGFTTDCVVAAVRDVL
jgi:transketolase